MEYQLVLQFHGDSLADLDAAVALEDELGDALGDTAEVDGHDTGSGETNIFIFTADPAATFQQIKPLLEQGNRLDKLTAAHREVDGEDYTVIWPEGSRKAFQVS